MVVGLVKERVALNMSKQIGVFIPARTTSKRLPNKIILPFGETNLFDIACKKLEQLPKEYGRYALICIS